LHRSLVSSLMFVWKLLMLLICNHRSVTVHCRVLFSISYDVWIEECK
jgi:hypothetical protein